MVFSVSLYADTTQTGYASWYGGKFHGRKTANGEVFDTYKYTAAHKTLPFDTVLKVENLENGRSVAVRINDRGPFVENRIIDLSFAAAKDLGMIESGIARVRIEIIESNGEKAERYSYKIQVAAYSDINNANAAVKKLETGGVSPSIEKTGKGIYRIVIKDIDNDKLENIKKKIIKCGFNNILIKKEAKI